MQTLIDQPNKVAIYFLVDPREPERIRYVGQAQMPRIRHLQHCSEIATTPKGAWIESMRQIGILPQMIVIEWVDRAEAFRTEKIWIARVKPEFLTNCEIAGRLEPELPFNPPPVSNLVAQTPLALLADVERQTILDMLNRLDWNKKEAAQRLGIGRQTLYNKIKDFELKEPPKPKRPIDSMPLS